MKILVHNKSKNDRRNSGGLLQKPGLTLFEHHHQSTSNSTNQHKSAFSPLNIFWWESLSIQPSEPILVRKSKHSSIWRYFVEMAFAFSHLNIFGWKSFSIQPSEHILVHNWQPADVVEASATSAELIQNGANAGFFQSRLGGQLQLPFL